VPDKKWLFREFTRCIKGAAPPIAFIGSTWTWSPRVWDPQCSVAAINATFSSPALPSWLSWEDNVLSGDVPESLKGTKFELTGVATFQVGGKAHQLEQLVKVSITSVGDHEGESSVSSSSNTALTLPAEQTYRDLTMEENKPSKSADSSSVGSPPPSHSGTPFRSPTIASNGLLGEASPPPSSLLPSLMGNANYQTGSLILPTQHMQIDGAPSNESDLLRQIQNQQLVQHQQYLAQAMYHAQMTESQMPVDPSQLPRQQSYLGQPFESQAELHQRYAAALNSPFDPAGVPANLSYTPPPELVAVALQQAYERSLNPACTSSSPLLPISALTTSYPQTQMPLSSPSGLNLSHRLPPPSARHLPPSSSTRTSPSHSLNTLGPLIPATCSPLHESHTTRTVSQLIPPNHHHVILFPTAYTYPLSLPWLFIPHLPTLRLSTPLELSPICEFVLTLLET
jgi:hypothetical protein